MVKNVSFLFVSFLLPSVSLGARLNLLTFGYNVIFTNIRVQNQFLKMNYFFKMCVSVSVGRIS